MVPENKQEILTAWGLGALLVLIYAVAEYTVKFYKEQKKEENKK